MVTGDKKGHCIIIKSSMYLENLTIINKYEPNIRAPKYTKQTLIELKNRQFYNNN